MRLLVLVFSVVVLVPGLTRAEEPFNPRDVRAIVLARALGDPTPEIEDYMRMKFSFASDRIILECSGK